MLTQILHLTNTTKYKTIEINIKHSFLYSLASGFLFIYRKNMEKSMFFLIFPTKREA
jgi:hypothetical protein